MASDRHTDCPVRRLEAMPKSASPDWATGICNPVRKLISRGTNDEELRQFIEAKIAGDHASSSRILNSRRNIASSCNAPILGSKIDKLADELCVAALGPIVNSLSADQLNRYIHYIRSVALEMVGRHKDAAFWSAGSAVGVVADIIMKAGLQHIQSDKECEPIAESVVKSLDVRVVDGLGEVLSETEFLKRRNWSVRDLRRSLAARSVFFIEIQGAALFPSYLAERTYNPRRLASVIRALGDLPGGSKHMFLITPKGSLAGRTPLMALRQGELGKVKNAACGFAER